MLYITDAKYIEGYKINVVFNDHVSGVVDLKNTIIQDHRPIFKELEDLKKFRNFKVDMDTIVWNNGLDLAPEFLRQHLVN